MSSSGVFLRGYYGAGNYGDDILLAVCVRAIRNVCLNNGLTVLMTHGDKLPVEVVKTGSATSKTVDYNAGSAIVILGGGGQFFSFQGKRMRTALTQIVLRAIGIDRLELIRTMVRFWNSSLDHCDEIVDAAIGLGLGPFALGSGLEERAARMLARCGFLHVRDEASLKWCQRWRVRVTVPELVDLCFCTKYWRTGEDMAIRLPNVVEGGLRVGIVVRNWPYGGANEWLGALVRAVNHLDARGVRVTLFVFDETFDVGVAEYFREYCQVFVYRSGVDSLNKMCNALGEHDVVVSTRAHGVFVSAINRVPCIAVDIEPKLRLAAQSVGMGDYVWTQPFDVKRLIAMVFELAEARDVWAKRMERNCSMLQCRAEVVMKIFEQWLRVRAGRPDCRK